MQLSNYDVVVVGAGAAGLTAAIGLARAGFTVAAIEAGAFPGSENWSGCVYFCENLAHPDILGPAGVEALAWERRLVERGFFATDGHSLLGTTYRDTAAFRHCYTVLRPVYDHHLGEIARRMGVALLNETTVESLIRENNRIVGVCTHRGPLYADLVFLAEGDASHLVTREGYERFTDPREAPRFLHGIKQIIEMPPGAIEEIFGVGAEEGVAYELLLRNGTLRGRQLLLNMGGFLYTNRQSLSIGLVLPVDNLHNHFGGDPNLLMEWFENLPSLRPWLRGGQRGAFGAKIIRGGGARDIPNLIDDGLAIGGAASAIGIDFPYPNFTGPATAMGLLITQAACRIRDTGASFTRENLRRFYLEPLQQTHYWQDVEFLRRWPAYVKRTQVFFDRSLDLALATAYIWTRPKRWLITKWLAWLRLLVMRVAGPGHWMELRSDWRHLKRALRLREIVARPSLGRLLLDGTVNALRDLFRKPRANLAPAGAVRLHYAVDAGQEPTGLPPGPLRRWFRRFAPILASAARKIYTNDDTPLAEKLASTMRLLVRQINLLDLLAAAAVALAAGASGVFLIAWDRLAGLLRWRKGRQRVRGLYRRYVQAARRTTDLTPIVPAAAQSWEARLGRLAYDTVKASHIHILWPKSLADKNAITEQGLWSVCPAHVYEARMSPLGQLQVIVNFENCIKCETCWRSSDLVDWGRDGAQRFIYPVYSPVLPRLLEAVQAAGLARPALPHVIDRWEAGVQTLAEQVQADPAKIFNGEDVRLVGELRLLLAKLERKLEEFDEALAKEPRTVDQGRIEYLEMLARYAQQLALRVVEEVRDSPLGDSPHTAQQTAHRLLMDVANALTAKAEERARRTWVQRFAWAAADGRQMRYHHLAGMHRILNALSKRAAGTSVSSEPSRSWLQAEDHAETVAVKRAEWAARLDAVLGTGIWRDLERHIPLHSDQDAMLRDLVAQVPMIELDRLATTLHPPLRKALLAELGSRDPSLAYRGAVHLWARDLAHLAPGSSAFAQAAQRWARGDEWACFTLMDAVATQSTQSGETSWKGEALFVPACAARSLLVLLGDRLVIFPADWPGLHIDALATLGLRGAGLARIQIDCLMLPETQIPVDYDRMHRVWSILSAADLTSIATGMADHLCRRAIGHASHRVQFPGLFHDEEARDTIGKFGAVKKMIAEMEAGRYLIETLDHNLSPVDFSSWWLERTGQIKALAAEVLGTAPGSLSYNAGQIFGGTGYSEDDMLAKYYRDASAWHFLGPKNVEVILRHGQALLSHWRMDSQRLAKVPEEVELFEQVAQRKALQGELDEIRNARSRLKGLAADWLASHADSSAEVAEGLARQDAQLLASKALLLRTHARLEHGRPAEVEMALVQVWLERASRSLEEFDMLVHSALDPTGQRDDRPVVEPGSGPPVNSYAAYLAAPLPYESGDFLATAVDLHQPRLVPEMVETDAVLAGSDRRFRELLSAYFGRPRGQGLSYERYIEGQHRPDTADLEFCRDHGFFRLPIPRDLGGEGRSKIDYYLLTTNAQRLADVAISLTIQANTSIGTTPVLLARDKDLPKAQKELALFGGDTELQKEIRAELEELLKSLAADEAWRTEEEFQRLQRRLGDTVLSHAVLKMLFHRFLQAWEQAQRSAKEWDPAHLKSSLEEALAAWQDGCGRADETEDELTRRRQACDLFLRWIASGQISAFALTEPSAGSDTARVATHARLRSVPVELDSAGVYRFIPAGGQEPRFLLDAERLEFRFKSASESTNGTTGPAVPVGAPAVSAPLTSPESSQPGGVYYQWSESAEPASIRFDEYDYETDNPQGRRYFEAEGRRVYFTDIAQLRPRDGRLWYDYWELTGAKMWITNGRMAGLLCLYAKTEEGITGFMVDRHAEGLIVGKDEAKMGQCGSPTNELSLQAVRVPRENVIGLEGRGQVNALETLNVGRAGLAMSSMAQMNGLIEESRAFARQAYGDIPAWAAWRLQRMEEACFTAEALAYEVIGRFEHPQTKSVRMESAIAKMLVSELLHSIIEFAEDIHGLAGQTQLHLVEKRKRDARILNIYEGTNEIQRFFILKDLATEVAPRWIRNRPSPPHHVGREALELEALKRNARQRIEAAANLFGKDLWQNPNLQANCFLLAEAAAWLKAAESTLGRLAWCSRLAQTEETTDAAAPERPASEFSAASETYSSKIDLGRRALARACAEARERLRRFDEELAHLRRGYYAPEVRAASMLFRRLGTSAPVPVPASQIAQPLRVLVIVEPLVVTVPHPHVVQGRLVEAHVPLGEGDRAALEAALRLREQAKTPVTIEVAAVGPKAIGQALRHALSLGVDRSRLVVSEHEPVTPDRVGAALAATIGSGCRFDLILGSGGDSSDEDGLAARFAAQAMGIPYVGTASQIAVQATDSERSMVLIGADGRHQRVRSLPAMATIEPGTLSLRHFTIAGYLSGLAKVVEAQRWPRKVASCRASFTEGVLSEPADRTDEHPLPLTPRAAAGRLLGELGLTQAAFVNYPFQGAVEEVAHPTFLEPQGNSRGKIIAVVAATLDSRLQPAAPATVQAAQMIAASLHGDLAVLLLAPAGEDKERQALGQLLGSFRGDIVVVPAANCPAEVQSRLLQECWPDLSPAPLAVVGEPWAEEALVFLGSRPPHRGQIALRVRRIVKEADTLVLETSRGRGKLRVWQKLLADGDVPCWVTLAGTAEIGDDHQSVPSGVPRVQRWAPRLERFYASHEIHRLLGELQQETGLPNLADADFIIDVGFGIGDRDGYEAVVEPLERTLRQLGVLSLAVGGSRKVTEELHLLPVDRQIGQSGVSVNPQVLLAIGISGAPQHLNYIGPRATILAFNRDAEAPIMTLNRRQPRPRVFPIIGNLFETVPALTAALREEHAGQTEFAELSALKSVLS